MLDTYPSLTVTLPTEIWYHIASYISLRELQQTKLYSLNRPFLTAYLHQKYETLPLFFSCGTYYNYDPHELSRKLDHFHSMVSGNARALTVSFSEYSFDPIYEDNRRSVFKLLRGLANFFRRKQKPTALKKRIAHLQASFPSIQKIRGALAELDSLNSIECTLICRRNSPILDFSQFLPLAVSAAWSSSRNTLTKLTLTIEHIFLDLAALGAITFPHLQEFELEIRRPVPVSLVDDADFEYSLDTSTEPLVAFLHHHTHVLSSLTLKSYPPTKRFAVNVFTQTSAIPSLRDLSLSLVLNGVGNVLQLATGLHSILESNSASVEKLSLCLACPLASFNPSGEMHRSYWDWWMSQSFLNIHFPHLEYLSLKFDPPRLILRYISCSQAALTVKSLYVETQISQSDVQLLANIFAETRGRCEIETLSLCIHTLTPTVLGYLALGFPGIKTLRLRYLHIGLEEDSEYNTEAFFAAYEGFFRVTYPDWALVELFLSDPIPEWYHQGVPFRTAVVQALPRVRYFNTFSRQDYPSRGVNYY